MMFLSLDFSAVNLSGPLKVSVVQNMPDINQGKHSHRIQVVFIGDHPDMNQRFDLYIGTEANCEYMFVQLMRAIENGQSLFRVEDFRKPRA